MHTYLSTEAIAKALLAGERGAVETCWLLAARSDRKELLQKADVDFVSVVQSETDALPIGEYKTNWHPDFVQPKLDQLTRYEKTITEEARAVCGRLLQTAELRRKEGKAK